MSKLSQNTVVLSALSADEEARLRTFKKEAFYFTGEDFANFNRWQEFFNLFFLYHLVSADDGSTAAARRSLDKATILLYTPSFFNRYRGLDWLSEEPMLLEEDVPGDLSWFDRREMILSLFHRDGDKARLVQSKASFVVALRHKKFFKHIRTTAADNPAYQKAPYLLFLISILLLKKDRFSEAKLFDPFRIEELEKTHQYYQKLFDAIV